MSKKKKVSLNQKNVKTLEEKRIQLDYELTEFTEEDYEYTIKYVFNEFIYSQEERGNSQATIDYYKRFYAKFKNFLQLIPDAEENPIAIIVKMPLQNLFVKSMGDVSIQTINNYLRAYRSFGNFAEERGYIQGFKCPIKEVEPKIKQVYSDAEIKKLLVKPKVDKYAKYRNYVIINLILSTGARSNTILNIKFEDIDLEEKTIFFNTTKAHKTVCIPLDNEITKILKEYIYLWKHASKKGYLFFNEFGEKLTRGGLTKAIATYNKSCGVDKTSIHLFRHTFAKKWIQSGKDIFSLKKILTHSELQMVERYSNIYSDDLRSAVNQNSILSQHKTNRGKTVSTRKRISLQNNDNILELYA